MTTLDPALVEAVNGLITHAVAMAGLKLRRHLPRALRSRANKLPPGEVHVHIPVDRDLLDRFDVFDEAFVPLPAVARRFGLPVICLRQTIEDYVRDLLVAGQRHTYELTAKLLNAPCLTGRTA